MTDFSRLVRPEIRALKPYQPAGFSEGMTRLNANESPWAPELSAELLAGQSLNRYPEARPGALTEKLAALYGTRAGETLVTRGSTEAIDLLIRTMCRPGHDGIVICPPTFGMYEVYAQLQGAAIRRVPLLSGDRFELDDQALTSDWNDDDKLLFLCSPNNPTGQRVPTARLAAICESLNNRAIVVIDSAYIEFASADPSLELLRAFDNVCVMRTLSKAWGLASARCGALLGNEQLLEMIARVQPPYSFPGICNAAVSATLDASTTDKPPRAARVIAERQRLAPQLAALRCVRRSWPSEANFILVEVNDPVEVVSRAEAAGLLLRNFGGEPGLANCLRVTIGTPAQNDQLIAALESLS